MRKGKGGEGKEKRGEGRREERGGEEKGGEGADYLIYWHTASMIFLFPTA